MKITISLLLVLLCSVAYAQEEVVKYRAISFSYMPIDSAMSKETSCFDLVVMRSDRITIYYGDKWVYDVTDSEVKAEGYPGSFGRKPDIGKPEPCTILKCVDKYGEECTIYLINPSKTEEEFISVIIEYPRILYNFGVELVED